MKRLRINPIWILGLVFLSAVLFTTTSCRKKTGCTDPLAINYDPDAEKDDGSCQYKQPEPGPTTEILEGDITTSKTLKATVKYILKGFVYVKSGATLTIEPGTIIKGEKSSKGTLIIERGAKIMAVGTPSKPIVFTSDQPKGQRDYGDWGGIIICGKAPVNLPGGEGTIEGGTGAKFGGTDPADNSGKLKYVRIEFSGIPFQPNQEINGLTLGGVGSGTEIEYIQISFCGDDSYEFFGGTVKAKYLVSFKAWDDDFDTDNGYTGKIQFAVSLRDPAIADQSGSNGFESDNDGQGTSATPITKPIFSNVSIYGPLANSANPNSQYKRAAHLRRNTKASIYNSVLAGFPDGLLIDGSSTETNASNNELQFRNNIIAGCTNPLKVTSGSTFDINTWFYTAGYGNSILNNISDLKITSLSLNSPNFIPQSNSPLLSNADFSNPNLSDAFFEKVTFRGAFGTTDWTSGWCNWDPQNTDY